MNRLIADPIANAVLYEGYILYPYRPSIKTRQRWTFGGLYPEGYCRVQGDSSSTLTECLVRGTESSSVEAVVRFLHLTARTAGEVVPPVGEWPDRGEPPFRAVDTLRVGDKVFHSWQEAVEREVAVGESTLGKLSDEPLSHPFAFPGGRKSEPVRNDLGEVAGLLVREQKAIEGVVQVSASRVEDGLFRLSLRVVNRSPWEGGDRDDALMLALVSTHAILGVRDGDFVSLTDPPDRWKDAASACKNVGVWPVLAGEEGQTDTMLASPIILYDYPQIAPESGGDFFDGTEMDEMLTLRVMTMTDEEKAQMASVDPRSSALLARVEGTARDQMLSLHGAVRGLRPIPEEGSDG